MVRNTKEIALCGVLSALAVVLILLGGIMPLTLYASPILASLVLIPIGCECQKKYAWCCYISIAILGTLLGSDKECALLFVFLGYYPLLKPEIDKRVGNVLGWIIKAAIFVAAMAIMYSLLIYVIGMASVVEEFQTTTRVLLYLTIGLGLVLFVVYDKLLFVLTLRYKMFKHRKK